MCERQRYIVIICVHLCHHLWILQLDSRMTPGNLRNRIPRTFRQQGQEYKEYLESLDVQK